MTTMLTHATAQTFLIHSAMVAYLCAAAAFAVGAVQPAGQTRRPERRLAWAAFAAGFTLALAAVAYRAVLLHRVPMQNLYEVFIAMGAMVFLVSLAARRWLGVGGHTWDALLAAAVLTPAGFVFDSQPKPLPPALQSWLFAPHVTAYLLAYVICAKAGAQALGQLLGLTTRPPLASHEQGTLRMVRLAFPLLTLGLILGAWWGKLAWGDYWNWDPKELWSLATWLIFVAYLHFRFVTHARYPRTNSALALLGLTAVIITLLWVNLSRIFSGLHSYA